MTPVADEAATLHERPAELLQRLIRFETVNPPGRERECVAWIEGLLRDAGIETRVVAKDPERPNLVARLPGRGQSPPLLLQGHVDVVPVADQDWTRPPFAAEEADGFIWGRGALDMKGGVAMMVAAMLRLRAAGAEPPGDVLLCVLSDEEAGGDCGARFLVSEHPDLFEGVRYALGEFGGFTLHVAGKRFAPISIGEKQAAWIRGCVRGPGGHASLPMRGGTMGRLGEVLTRLDRRSLPVHVTPIARRFVTTLAGALGPPRSLVLRGLLVPGLSDRVLRLLGEQGTLFEPMLHNTVNATVVRGGDKDNVIPAEVELSLDARVLPGFAAEDVCAEIAALAGPDLDLEVQRFDAGGPAEPDLGLWDVLAGALGESDPGVVALPYLMPAVTDGRFFARLGIQSYGFTPMRLPEGFEFHSLVHAADERVPAEAIEFGTRTIADVLERF
jgi:acetylornithine deacetylase/succinyl-diaminopimelate desuccinylase-like protein